MAAGVIIAGGRSTRFGERDKAVADLAGTPMIRRVGDRLAGVVDRFVVNCRDDQVSAIEDAFADAAYEVTFAVDPEPDRGPMAGIGTGLSAVDAEYAFVVACDMPFVEPTLVAYLFERATGHDAAVPRLDDGWFQTTHSVYRAATMAAACEAALDRGEGKILAALDGLDSVVVDEAELRDHGRLDSFSNVNTAAEFHAAATGFSGE